MAQQDLGLPLLRLWRWFDPRMGTFLGRGHGQNNNNRNNCEQRVLEYRGEDGEFHQIIYKKGGKINILELLSNALWFNRMSCLRGLLMSNSVPSASAAGLNDSNISCLKFWAFL